MAQGLGLEQVRFDTEDGVSLEAEIRHPDGAAKGSAVICHAHPRHGGSKDHPVLWSLRIELARRGFVVVSFNFRGVMGSGGSFGGGEAEVLDVRAAVGRIRQDALGPTVVTGWSFGAHVALREALDDGRVAALALLGLPLGGVGPALPPLPPPERLRLFDRPVLLLAGAADEYCPGPELEALGQELPNAEVRILLDADHYFRRREREAAAIVGTFAAALVR